MKKNGTLNTELAKLFAQLRHTDQIVVGDCGLPVPEGVKEIDLSLKLGTPSFLEVLAIVKEEVAIEQVLIAEEIKAHNPDIHEQLVADFHEHMTYLSHEALKEQTKQAKAIIRTGEATPYANIIVQSNVIF